MAVKIAVTQEYEDEKRHVHSNRLLLFLLQKKLTAFLTFGGYAPDWYVCTGIVFSPGIIADTSETL